MRVLVVTDVHRPLDARIFARQIGTVLTAGEQVTYVAPWKATGTKPPVRDGLVTVDVPRASGRRRLSALLAVRRAVRQLARRHDVLVAHDPEVLVAVMGIRGLPPVVWDVHEDTAAALADRTWVPAWGRRLLRAVVRQVERTAERRCRLVLAERSYQTRFSHEHPVVRNMPLAVAPEARRPGGDRVVYTGRISRSRGFDAMVELGRRLRPAGVTVELVGDVDGDVAQDLRVAAARGDVRWLGFLPNEETLEHVRGATAGLSLLADMPNFRSSLPSKVAEYLAQGVPVVTTPLPEAVELVSASGGGVVVPFDDVDAAHSAVVRLLDDADGRAAMAAAGHRYAVRHLRWDEEGARFLALLRSWARS